MAALVNLQLSAYRWEPMVFRIWQDSLSCWSMPKRDSRMLGQMGTIRACKIRRIGSRDAGLHTLDYIRMRVKEYPEQGGIVEVAELML